MATGGAAATTGGDAAPTLSPAQFDRLLATLGAARSSAARMTVFSSGDGLEWRTWRTNAELTQQINRWGDDRFTMEIKKAMEGGAARAIADIPLAGRTGRQVLDAYQERFLPEAASRLALAEFDTATMLPSESLLAWHTRIRELFDRAYPTDVVDTSTLLIRRFTIGLLDRRIKEFVMDRNPVTFTASLDLAQSKLATFSLLDQHPNTSGSATKQQSMFAMASNNTGCWYCGNSAHTRANCADFKKGKEYFAKYFGKDEASQSGGRSHNGRSGAGKKYWGKKKKTGQPARGCLLYTSPSPRDS